LRYLQSPSCGGFCVSGTSRIAVVRQQAVDHRHLRQDCRLLPARHEAQDGRQIAAQAKDTARMQPAARCVAKFPETYDTF
ncbi:hypothetical protein, partial [Aquamicrobium sp. LC103]|uniref:hypothetical protein n=1 Tax=Aquamicrobium sp. LC103 TaxID=1120658 RepID=UPI00197D9322